MFAPGTSTRTRTPRSAASCSASVNAGRGDEVRGGQVERLARGGDREVVERLDVGVADAGARAHHHHRAAVVALGSSVRQVAVAGEHLARRLQPVLRERAEQPAHDRAARRARGCRASGRGPRRRPSTPRRSRRRRSARSRPSATRILRCVRLASRLRGVRLDRPEAAHPHAGVGHPLEHLALELHPADGVDQHVALDAGPRALAQRVGHLVGDVAAPVDVGEQADRAAAPRGSSPGSRGRSGRR